MDDYSLKIMIREQAADRRRAAARARLRREARRQTRMLKRPLKPAVRNLAWDKLGTLLIRLGLGIKERYGLGPEPVEEGCCRSRG